jgi:hypothetical protein
MARIPCGRKPRGSQHWLQVIANKERKLFDRAMSQAGITTVEWVSVSVVEQGPFHPALFSLPHQPPQPSNQQQKQNERNDQPM